MALKNNFDVIVELEAPLRAIEDLTGFRLWHDLQQRVGPDRELPDENQQHGRGHPNRKESHRDGSGEPVVALDQGDGDQGGGRLYEQA